MVHLGALPLALRSGCAMVLLRALVFARVCRCLMCQVRDFLLATFAPGGIAALYPLGMHFTMRVFVAVNGAFLLYTFNHPCQVCPIVGRPEKLAFSGSSDHGKSRVSTFVQSCQWNIKARRRPRRVACWLAYLGGKLYPPADEPQARPERPRFGMRTSQIHLQV